MWIFDLPEEVLLDVYGPLWLCGLEALALTVKPRRNLTLKELSNRRRGVTVDISSTLDGENYPHAQYDEPCVACGSEQCGRRLTMRSNVLSLDCFVAYAIRDTYVRTWKFAWGSLTTDFCREVINVASTVDVDYLRFDRVNLREISAEELRLLATSFRSVGTLHMGNVRESTASQIDDHFIRACAQKNIARLVLPKGIPNRYEDACTASDDGLLAFAFNEEEPRSGCNRYLSVSHLHVSRQCLRNMIEVQDSAPLIFWNTDGLLCEQDYIPTRGHQRTDREVRVQ